MVKTPLGPERAPRGAPIKGLTKGFVCASGEKLGEDLNSSVGKGLIRGLTAVEKGAVPVASLPDDASANAHDLATIFHCHRSCTGTYNRIGEQTGGLSH
eukprot:273816-Prorocentrum_minimum.AAC.1